METKRRKFLGAVNVESIVLAGLSLSLAIASYAAKGWVEKVDAAIADRGPRIERLETESEFRWKEIDDRMSRLEHANDRVASAIEKLVDSNKRGR